MREIITAKCKKCGTPYSPDLKTRGVWICQHCQAKNPNLYRHYRSVADLFILGLIGTIIAVLIQIPRSGLGIGAVLMICHAALLLITIIKIYRASMPWRDNKIRGLIWTVFGLAFVFNFIMPLVLSGFVNIPFFIVYAIVVPYLIWLHVQTKKAMPTNVGK